MKSVTNNRVLLLLVLYSHLVLGQEPEDFSNSEYYVNFDEYVAEKEFAVYDYSDSEYTDIFYYDAELESFAGEVEMVHCDTFTETLNETIALVLSEQPSQAIVDMFNLQGDQGFIPIQPDVSSAECKKLPVHLLVQQKEDMNLDIMSLAYIHNQKTKKLLGEVKFFVGEIFQKIMNLFPQDYYLAEPTIHPMKMEGFIKEQGKFRNPKDSMDGWVFPMWPSVWQYTDAVAMNVWLRSKESESSVISLLYFAETEETLEYVDRLGHALRSDSRVEVRKTDLWRTRRLLLKYHDDLEATNDYRLQKAIRKKCVRMVLESLLGKYDSHGRAAMVVIYMDVPSTDNYSTITMIRALLHHMTGIDDLKLPWIIADIRFAYETQYMPPYNGQEIQSAIYNPIVNMDMNPVYSQTMNKGMSKTGVLETGLKRAIRLLESRVINKNLSKTDFFRYCFPNPCKASLEVPGFPTNVQIVTRQIFLEAEKDNCGDEFNSTKLCYADDAPMFTRSNLQHECEPSFDDQVDVIHIKDYKLCRNVPLEQVMRRPAFAALIQDPPFVIKRPDNTYDGLAVEIYRLVEAELSRLGIVLDLKFVDADGYGAKLDDGNWTGVFGQLSRNIKEMTRKDKYVVLGLGQVSKTKERATDSRFVFSPAYAYAYYTYMVNKDEYFNGYTQFLSPFHPYVWYALLAVLIASGFYISVMQAWNPFKENLDPETPKFTGHEGFWHSFMVITQAGAPFATQLYATRVFSIFYWFFALIVCACYTGNLASFLSESEIRLTWTINDPRYKYGVVGNSSVASKMKDIVVSSSPWWRAVAEAETVANYSEGVQRVLDEKFVMIGTSLVLENYMRQHNCQTYVWKGRFYEAITSWQMEPIAFPMRKRWRHSRPFRRMMLRLKEDGRIQALYNKWLKRNACKQDEDDETASLNVDNFLGLFILVVGGIVGSFVILAVKLSHLKLRDGQREERRKELEGETGERLTKPGIEDLEDTRV